VAAGVYPIVDSHNDLLLEVAHRAYVRGEANPLREYWLDPLRRGHVALQVCPVYADLQVLPEGALRHVLGQVAAFNRAVRANADAVHAVRCRSDLSAVGEDGRIGLMLSMEGAEAIGYSTWMVEVMHELGVRMISLTWNRRNPFADGAAETRDGGLSRLGEELLKAVDELGMIVDLAHASERTFWDVLERFDGSRVVVSHAACRAVLDHPRNLSDDQLAALASAGGVLGMMAHPIVIDPQQELERLVDHIDHAVAVMGIDAVGLGGDFTRQVVRATNWIEPSDSLLPAGMRADDALAGLAGPEDYGNLVRALEARGYDGERIRAIAGGNFLRFFEHALPAS